VLTEVLRDRPARLFIVGEGPEKETALALARELGVADALDFLPWQPVGALSELYRKLHVVLVPSRATDTWVEQFGRIIPEGQASGAVIAGYASGAIPEVGGEACVLVPEGEIVQLASAVSRLLHEPARYASLRTAGIGRAALATWDSVAERQFLLYDSIVRNSPCARRRLPSAQDLREQATIEFGPAATLTGGVRRPFALPKLRRDTTLTRAVGRSLDRTTRLLGRLRARPE
jgi:glycosyltransferase involved in cell wall biosynthesis